MGCFLVGGVGFAFFFAGDDFAGDALRFFPCVCFSSGSAFWADLRVDRREGSSGFAFVAIFFGVAFFFCVFFGAGAGEASLPRLRRVCSVGTGSDLFSAGGDFSFAGDFFWAGFFFGEAFFAGDFFFPEDRLLDFAASSFIFSIARTFGVFLMARPDRRTFAGTGSAFLDLDGGFLRFGALTRRCLLFGAAFKRGFEYFDFKLGLDNRSERRSFTLLGIPFPLLTIKTSTWVAANSGATPDNLRERRKGVLDFFFPGVSDFFFAGFWDFFLVPTTERRLDLRKGTCSTGVFFLVDASFLGAGRVGELRFGAGFASFLGAGRLGEALRFGTGLAGVFLLVDASFFGDGRLREVLRFGAGFGVGFFLGDALRVLRFGTGLAGVFFLVDFFFEVGLFLGVLGSSSSGMNSSASTAAGSVSSFHSSPKSCFTS